MHGSEGWHGWVGKKEKKIHRHPVSPRRSFVLFKVSKITTKFFDLFKVTKITKFFDLFKVTKITTKFFDLFKVNKITKKQPSKEQPPKEQYLCIVIMIFTFNMLLMY